MRLDARQSNPDRYRAFLRCLEGEALVIVGNRSVVYAPAANLGLIAVWDDGDPLHSEPLAPYVHARDAALLRQELQSCALLFVGPLPQYRGRAPGRDRLARVGLARAQCAAQGDSDVSAGRRRSSRRTGQDSLDRVARGEQCRAQRAGSRAGRPTRVMRHGWPAWTAASRHGAFGARGRSRRSRLDRCPACAWCGALAVDWHCDNCDGTRMRLVGAGGTTRTAEDLGRAFPGVRIIVADGDHPILSVGAEPALVIATRGAEPRCRGGIPGSVAAGWRPHGGARKPSGRRGLPALVVQRDGPGGTGRPHLPRRSGRRPRQRTRHLAPGRLRPSRAGRPAAAAVPARRARRIRHRLAGRGGEQRSPRCRSPPDDVLGPVDTGRGQRAHHPALRFRRAAPRWPPSCALRSFEARHRGAARSRRREPPHEFLRICGCASTMWSRSRSERPAARPAAPGARVACENGRMPSLSLVFAGSPAAAVPSLRALAASSHRVRGCHHSRGLPAGTPRHPHATPVADAADGLGLRVIRANRLAGEPTEAVTELAPDLGVIVAYGGLVREPLLSTPRLGWINLHFSLLPRWRGAAPVQRAIIAGDDLTGASVFQLVPELDAGDLFGQLTQPIGALETAGHLLGSLAESRCRASRSRCRQPCRRNRARRSPGRRCDARAQARRSTTAGSTGRRRPSWSSSLIRGVTPEPGAFTTVDGARLKVLRLPRSPGTPRDGRRANSLSRAAGCSSERQPIRVELLDGAARGQRSRWPPPTGGAGDRSTPAGWPS